MLMGRPGEPTKKQREIIRPNGYDPGLYLVISNEAGKMCLLKVATGVSGCKLKRTWQVRTAKVQKYG